MPIDSNKPTVIPATGERSYPYLGFPLIAIEWPDPNGQPMVRFQSRNFGDNSQGFREWAPDGPYERVIFNLDDEAAAQAQAGDPRLAQCAALLMQILEDVDKGAVTLLAQPPAQGEQGHGE